MLTHTGELSPGFVKNLNELIWFYFSWKSLKNLLISHGFWGDTIKIIGLYQLKIQTKFGNKHRIEDTFSHHGDIEHAFFAAARASL